MGLQQLWRASIVRVADWEQEEIRRLRYWGRSAYGGPSGRGLADPFKLGAPWASKT